MTTQPQREREDVIRARQEQLRPSMVDDKWGQFSGLEHKLFNAIDTLLAALAEAQERVEKLEARLDPGDDSYQEYKRLKERHNG